MDNKGLYLSVTNTEWYPYKFHFMITLLQKAELKILSIIELQIYQKWWTLNKPMTVYKFK